MPFPTIAATNTSGTTSSSTSHIVSLPAGISAGDLLIVGIALNAVVSDTITFPTGWTDRLDPAYVAGLRLKAASRVADGAEGSTITVTSGNAARASHLAYRITGQMPVVAPEASTGATGTGDPDPDSLTSSSGAKNFLWIAIGGVDSVGGVAVNPPNYGLSQLRSGTLNTDLYIAGRNLNAATENPGIFDVVVGALNYVAGTMLVYGSLDVSDPTEMIRSELSDNWDATNTDNRTPSFVTSADPEVLSSRQNDLIKVYESRPRVKRRADHRYDYATYIAQVTIQVDVGHTPTDSTLTSHSARVLEEVERIIQAGRTAPDAYWDLLEQDTFTFQHQYRNFARNIMNVNVKRIVRQIPGT